MLYNLPFLKITDELFIKARVTIFRHMMHHAKMSDIQNVYQTRRCTFQLN